MHYLSIQDDADIYKVCSPDGVAVLVFYDIDEAMAAVSHLNGGLSPEIASKLEDFLDAALDL